uniref:Uncharacterized protein n=1 Tax=Xenopus tropicalis TaxID=8364 RepID=A0A1B8Y8H0_XENTR
MTAELWKRRQLADEQLGGFLVAADLPESDCAGPVSVRLLDAAGGWGAFPGCLGSQLLAGSFPSGGFTGGLLGTGHLKFDSSQRSIELL